MSEQPVVNAILDYLHRCGHCAIRINSGLQIINSNGNRRAFHGAPAGTSDIIACVDGRFVAIECKAGKNKPTKLQADFLQNISERGGIAIVAYSVEDVIFALNAIDKSGIGKI